MTEHRTTRRGSQDALAAAMRAHNIDRREFLRLLRGSAVLLGGASILSACGVEGSDSSATTAGATTAAAGATTATTAAAAPTQLNFANWPFYIDVTEDGYFDTTSLEDFEAEFGISVNYIEEINDNDEFFGKVQAPLSDGQDIERDIAVLTDWMAARFIRLGWVEEIDKANVPNAANLVDALKSPGFDPERKYTLPWQSGLTAIGYDPSRTGRELTSINDIFDPAFAGKVTMLTEMRDTVGLVMLGLGLDPAQATTEDAKAATDRIGEAVAAGQIRAFTGNEYTVDLASGDAWVSFAWSGDVIQLQADNPDLEFLIPDEGVMLWSDNMLIPKGATNKLAAEMWMNYAYDPRVAAKIESWVNFICPVQGAQQALRDLGGEIGDDELVELADDQLIFPDDATLSKAHVFKGLEEDEEREFNELFQAVIGA
ncbi:MAG: spermidine/putrescine ABC transporter substrate-binding protein [Acidimicrobiia bacterium]|nr:spermidine/putrescine ABC transporter substrate-binding protein [Acidimicrobiia bacterium]